MQGSPDCRGRSGPGRGVRPGVGLWWPHFWTDVPGGEGVARTQDKVLEGNRAGVPLICKHPE